MGEMRKSDDMSSTSDEQRHDLPSRFAVFSAKNGRPDVVARFENDDVWLTQKHLAVIFNTSKQLVSHHIKNILESGELEASRTVKKYLTVQSEGGRDIARHVDHYNLDMVIALGYRIDSPVAIRFRQWATERLHELIQKGFALEDERLKQGGNRYFKELLQRIRDIRASERNFCFSSRSSSTSRNTRRCRRSRCRWRTGSRLSTTS